MLKLYYLWLSFSSYARVVSSERAGMGKSLFIRRLSEQLTTLTSQGPHHVIIPLHGPKVTPDTLIESLNKYIGNSQATMFHLDISPSVSDV